MKKYIFLLLLSLNLLKADYFYSVENICITDFYVKDGNFYYIKSSDSSLNYTTYGNQYESIFGGFVFDSNDNSCRLESTVQTLGLTYADYMFLIAFSGLIIGSAWLFGFSLIMSRKG
jgi:hypothetical protein